MTNRGRASHSSSVSSRLCSRYSFSIARSRCKKVPPQIITEISKSRLNERMSMLLEPITETSSSIVKCLACRIVGALYKKMRTPARSSAS